MPASSPEPTCRCDGRYFGCSHGQRCSNPSGSHPPHFCADCDPRQRAQVFKCALCTGPIWASDSVGGGLISVNVDGHARAAHRTCPNVAGGHTSYCRHCTEDRPDLVCTLTPSRTDESDSDSQMPRRDDVSLEAARQAEGEAAIAYEYALEMRQAFNNDDQSAVSAWHTDVNVKAAAWTRARQSRQRLEALSASNPTAGSRDLT